MSAYDDGMTAPLRAAAYVQAQGDMGRARGEQTRQRSLAAQYYSGGVDPAQTGRFLGDVAQAGGDPQAFQREAFARAGQHAAMLVNAPDAMKPQAYAQLAREMHGLGFQVPLQYDPQALPMIARFAQQHGPAGAVPASLQEFGAMTAGMTPDDVDKARRINLGLEPRALAPQVIDTGNGYYGVDRRNLNASPVVVRNSEQPAPASRQAAGPQRTQVNLTDEALAQLAATPPEERAIALQAILTGGAYHAGPDGQPAPDLSPDLRGPQLRSAPKPAEQERLRLAQEASQRAAEASARADEAAARASKGNVPAGYRFKPGTDELERIPGAPQAIGKPLSAPVVAKLTKQAATADNTLDLLGNFRDDYAGNTLTGAAENVAGQLGLPGATPGQADWWQRYDRQKNQVRNELFGSALTPSEQAAFERADIRPSMAPDRIRANLRMQESIIRKGLARQASVWKAQGFNSDAIDAAISSSVATGYTVGQIIDHGGKKYRVTDVSDPNDPDLEEVR